MAGNIPSCLLKEYYPDFDLQVWDFSATVSHPGEVLSSVPSSGPCPKQVVCGRR